MPIRRRFVVALAIVVAIAVFGLEPERIAPRGIDGSLLLIGTGDVHESVVKQFVELAGKSNARIVVVCARADTAAIQDRWKPLTQKLTVLEPSAATEDALKDATGVWAIQHVPHASALAGVLKRNGLVALAGPAAGSTKLLPGTQVRVMDQATSTPADELAKPGIVTITLEPGAALLTRGRDMRALTDKPIRIFIARSETRPARTIEIKPNSPGDLTTLRRVAHARTQTPYPPKEPATPNVPTGSLLIVGGGGMPADVTKKFIDLAGGPDKLIVVLPISMPDPIPPTMDGRFLRRAGAKNVVVIKSRELADVEASATLELLRKAGGVWFDGGRQWRFVDAYAGTKFEKELWEVLKRGGVIGGSSAGASIQGDYLCRGDPLGPGPIMCEGYEKGLGFLPGVGIDQHFTQRKRQPDMTSFMAAYPQFLGIGLDEATAMVVKGTVAEVMGRGKVHFYDRRKPVPANGPDYETVAAGGRYDLKARVILGNAQVEPVHPGIIADVLPARSIGPANGGGRVTDVEAVESDPRIIYVAGASGGVWKTINGGNDWTPIFDRENVASIGDIAVSQSQPNIVWVGTGEANARNSVSWGDGVYKSIDGGRTWENMGLKESRHIGRVIIHPKNPDVVYVAALGRLWGPNAERGLFKTSDGGQTWQHCLKLDADTGCIDVALDPHEPDTLYACAYQVRRGGYAGSTPSVQFGPKAGIYKTTDGGVTWARLSAGLPERPLGRCGIAVSRHDPRVLVAVVQTDRTITSFNFGQAPAANSNPETGGVFRSEDEGKTWRKLNDLCPRPFYFGQVRIDPTDDQRVYVLGVALNVSSDGGQNFPPNLLSRGIYVDQHALWINPQDSKHMILGNDGGLYMTADRAKTWEGVRNLVLGQFYSVAVDMRRPYRVYGGTQDTGCWAGRTATQSTEGIVLADWRRLAGGDTMACAVDPSDHTIVYSAAQYGALQRFNFSRQDPPRAIHPQPARGTGPYRFHWHAPLVISPHDPKTIFFGGNMVFRSTDRGDTWTSISSDLSRGISGVPGFGHAVTALCESPRKAGLLWAGTDDGRLHVWQPATGRWLDVSARIPAAPAECAITAIECSHFDENTAYVAVDRHRHSDLKPYLFKTTNGGQTWTAIVGNLPPEEPVRVIRSSSRNPNLLLAGTECGLYVSLDQGRCWHRYRGLPTVPVADLTIHPRERELVVGTHGRSVYLIDIAPLEEITAEVSTAPVHLFTVKPASLIELKRPATPSFGKSYRAPNPPVGAVIHYLIRSATSKPVQMSIIDAEGNSVAVLAGSDQAGAHRVVWNLKTTAGDPVKPGFYTAVLEADRLKKQVQFEVQASNGVPGAD